MHTGLSPYVPARYLASIGLLEMLADADPDATLHWDEQDNPIITTRIPEGRIVAALVDTFLPTKVELHNWRPVETAGVCGETGRIGFVCDEPRYRSAAPVALKPVFKETGGGTIVLPRLPGKDGTTSKVHITAFEDILGKECKSQWCFWSGQSSLHKILFDPDAPDRSLCGAIDRNQAELQALPLAAALAFQIQTKKRFSFDSSSCQNAFNTGYQIADKDYHVAPLMELLSAVGASWFPAEINDENLPAGWVRMNGAGDRALQYFTWNVPLKLDRARFVALHGDPRCPNVAFQKWTAIVSKSGKVDIMGNASKTQSHY